MTWGCSPARRCPPRCIASTSSPGSARCGRSSSNGRRISRSCCIAAAVCGSCCRADLGPQMSPAMYREYFQPRERAMWQIVKQRAPHLKIMLHCCGGVRELLPGLIDAGLEAINPVQVTCRGMEPAGLKRDFGDRLTFWGGGCDTRDVLIKGTPAQVTEHVRKQVEILRPGGGFIFQQVHNILADVPPANVVAMYDAVGAA